MSIPAFNSKTRLTVSMYRLKACHLYGTTSDVIMNRLLCPDHEVDWLRRIVSRRIGFDNVFSFEVVKRRTDVAVIFVASGRTQQTCKRLSNAAQYTAVKGLDSR